jgi:hypothetical protein
MSMQTIRVAAGSALLGLLGSAALFAQTPSPTPSTTSPSAASSPHQHEATGSTDQTMKSCMARQAKATPQASKGEMTKACDEQMKAQQENLSKAHEDSGKTTPAPR